MAMYEVRQVTTTTRTTTQQQQQQHHRELEPSSLELPWPQADKQLATEEWRGRTLESLSRRLHRTRAGRVRDALFPETAEAAMGGGETLELELQARMGGEATAVQKLSEPAQTLKTAVVNLINYQEDADVAMFASGELSRLLRDTDAGVVARAASLLLLLAKKQACRLAFATQVDLVDCAVGVIGATDDLATLQSCVGFLCHVSRSEQGCLAIVQCRRPSVQELVRLLASGDERCVFYSITCLHNLLLVIEEAKAEVRVCGGVEQMVQLLSHSSERFLALCVDCLQLVAFANQETKLLILNAGGPSILVDILRQANYEKLLFVTARLLKVLSVCASNKPAIIDCGGMQALGRHLKTDSGRLILNVLWTLRNLSDQAFHLRDVDQLLCDLVDMLGCQDADYVTCAAGILCNLTCQNPHNKAAVTAANGAVALTQTLCATQDREEITEPVVCALRHVTHQHDQARQAAEAVRYHYGITVLMKLLNPSEQQSRRPLVKAALGLCRNLALFDENCAPLREHGAVEAAVDAMQQVSVPNSPGGSERTEDFVDGVRSEEVAEAALACLQALCREQQSKDSLLSLQPSVMPLLSRTLHSSVDYIQRSVTGLLAELTADPRAAQLLEAEGSSARLTQLLHSRNDAVATYAAAILYQMAADKPQEYRERLQSELGHSLSRDPQQRSDLPPPAYDAWDRGQLQEQQQQQQQQFGAHSMDNAVPYQYQYAAGSGPTTPRYSESGASQGLSTWHRAADV